MIDDDRLYQTIGKRLRELRKEHHLTQESMAKILGLERTSITNIELGKQRAAVHALYRCCEYFEVPLDHLFPSIRDPAIAKPELPPDAARALEKARAANR